MILLGTGRDGTRHLLRAQRPDEARALGGELSLPPVLARLLASRGVTDPARARALLLGGAAALHDPFRMDGVAEAVDRLLGAARDGGPVLVVGDDDLDGVAGAALLAGTFADAGLRVVTVFERRRSGGPGSLDLRAEVLRERASGVVTVDGAGAAPESVASATSAGAWVVLTDHHGTREAPPGALLVDPARPGSLYPFRGLSGAGVAWKLASALASQLGAERRQAALERLEASTALAALATLSDLSPLVDENRVLVARGLAALSERPGAGLSALRAVAGLGGRRTVSARQAACRLVPRLNAAARLGRPELAAALLSEPDPQVAARLASEVESMNSLRKSARERVLADVRGRLAARGANRREPVVVESGSEAAGWLQGVLGSAALALSRELSAPVLLLAERGDLLHGSGRSRAGADLRGRLEPVARALALAFGGHENAVGIVLPDAAFARFREAARAAFANAPVCRPDPPALLADTEILASDLDASLAGRLELLGPHGPGNPRPLFLLRGAVPLGRCRPPEPDRAALVLDVGGLSIRAGGPAATELTRPRRAGARDILVHVGRGPEDGPPVLSVVGLREAA